ncbi:MAG TPA: heparin lyase I family protein, partial [Ferruginibacter sp.]|nr:heparin lyase I family protein [Ferruginibacter sp.]
MKPRASLLRIILFACMLVGYGNKTTAQAVLNANGPGNTYELINSVFAPGYDVVENPECVHPSFGRHIAEIFDTGLNKFVFEFYSHVAEDNDRCINFDRQRIEIKTYDQSPDSLIGTVGETVTYKWRFKIPTGFQPSSSFTHIHQVKAVGGDDDQPIFTLTPRKGTPNKLELIYVLSGTSGSLKPAIVNLSLFEGVWVEVVEQIKVGAMGTYSISINRVSDGALLLSYSNPNISTIRPDNSFIRPKWGIYRSLNVPADLRDESIRFSDLS